MRDATTTKPLDLRGLPDPAKYERFVEAMGPDAWWHPGGPLGGLHLLNQVRLEYFTRALGGFGGKRVLDVGGGGGIMAEAMARAGDRVVGIDASPKSIEVARDHARQGGLEIDYQEGTAEALHFEDEFDQVFAVDVLEHVEDVQQTVAACARALKTGGAFGFLTHNQTLEAFTFLIWQGEYELDFIPKGNHDFHKFVSPGWLCGLLGQNGLQPKEVRDIRFTPEGEAVRIELTDGMSVSYPRSAVKEDETRTRRVPENRFVKEPNSLLTNQGG